MYTKLHLALPVKLQRVLHKLQGCQVVSRSLSLSDNSYNKNNMHNKNNGDKHILGPRQTNRCTKNNALLNP